MSSLLEFKNICKNFYRGASLKNVSFQAKSGEVLALVGRPLEKVSRGPERTPPSREQVLIAENFTGRGFTNVSFHLRKGEILGFFGLVGAGRTELMRGIFGADEILRGELTYLGQKKRFTSPRQAVKNGIGFLSAKKENAFAQEHCTALNVKTSSIRKKIAELSGGNQQKALIARWLSMDPRILVLDEPTKGVDVGAKSEIYRIIRNIADRGISVILVSSELPEVIGLSDRIYVMKNGRIVAQVPREAATEEAIISYAMMTDTQKEAQV